MKINEKEFAKIIASASTRKEYSPKEIAANLWSEMSARNKLKNLDEIFEMAKRIRAEAQGKINVKISSASELGGEEKTKIESLLADKYKKEIIIEYLVDKSLGAGIVVEAEGKIFGLSLQNKIQLLKKALAN